MLRQTTFFLAITLTLISCDPGFAVILNNNSGKQKFVTISNVHKQQLLNRDSVIITDTSQFYFFSDKLKRQTILLTKKDTVEKSYSFMLEKGKRALIQVGMGGPDLNQKIIVDNSDTILLKHDKRTVIRKKLMYTDVSTTIQ